MTGHLKNFMAPAPMQGIQAGNLMLPETLHRQVTLFSLLITAVQVCLTFRHASGLNLLLYQLTHKISTGMEPLMEPLIIPNMVMPEYNLNRQGYFIQATKALPMYGQALFRL